jgi:hypothetical protein
MASSLRGLAVYASGGMTQLTDQLSPIAEAKSWRAASS